MICVNFFMNFASKKEKLIILGFMMLTIVLFFVFGFQHLTKFVTADEHYWMYERVPQYWRAVEKFDLLKTFINDKPGVTVALFSYPAFVFERHPEKYVTKIDEDLDRYDTTRIEKLLLAFRLPILIICGLALLYLFWIVRKISSPWIALWTAIFTGLSPIILGVSQVINPDAFLWIFSSGAIFSYIALLKFSEKKYLFLTVFFTGFGLLTKYSVDILFPFYLFLLVYFYFCDSKPTENIREYFRKHLFYYLLIFGGSFTLVALFIPGVILKPVYLYRMTIGVKDAWPLWTAIAAAYFFLLADTFLLKSKLVVFCKEKYSRFSDVNRLFPAIISAIFLILLIGRIFFPDWMLFEKIPFDLKNVSDVETTKYATSFLQKILLEFNPLVFSLTPAVLILVLFTWIYASWKKVFTYSFFATAFSFFIVAYYLSFIATDILATVRYSIIIYPLAAFVAASGISELEKFFRPRNSARFGIAATLLILFCSIFTLYSVRPFYFNYVNSFLPKDKTVTDAWGFGGYEAAQYLKTLPNAENLTVWSDYYGVCEFFPGKCITDYRFEKQIYKIDYYALTRRGRIKYTPFYNSRLGKYESFSQAFKYYDRKNPEWELLINGRPENYVRIFKANLDEK